MKYYLADFCSFLFSKQKKKIIITIDFLLVEFYSKYLGSLFEHIFLVISFKTAYSPVIHFLFCLASFLLS